jgi:hypothetical protein
VDIPIVTVRVEEPPDVIDEGLKVAAALGGKFVIAKLTPSGLPLVVLVLMMNVVALPAFTDEAAGTACIEKSVVPLKPEVVKLPMVDHAPNWAELRAWTSQ